MRINFIIFIISLLFVCNSFAQDAGGKRERYEQLQQQIFDLEEKAQYHGDEELIRQRLNLPQKLPSYEEWIRLNIDSIESKQSQPDVQTTEPEKQKKEPEKVSVDTDSKVKTQTSSIAGVICQNQYDEKRNLITDSSGNARQSCTLTGNEIIINFSIFLLLLLVNFIFYCKNKKIRFLLISTPFDLFVKKEEQNLSLPTNYKKYFYELIILTLFVVCYFSLSSGFKSSPEENYLSTLVASVFIFVFVHIAYLIIRLIVAFSSRCPKCKMTYASRVQNSYDEPKTTYEKRYTNWVDIRETGISVSEYMCINCNHQWKKTKSYDKSIGKNH